MMEALPGKDTREYSQVQKYSSISLFWVVTEMPTIHQKGILYYFLTIPQFLKCAKDYIHSKFS